MTIPTNPKIYHIVHVDRLSSILSDGSLLCDAEINRREREGSIIGIENIKRRRLTSKLTSHPNLHVGDCVPFYFCPRSIMLYLIYTKNHPNLSYRGGQTPIIHLESDLYKVIEVANRNKQRWAFTLSNAGTVFFEDRSDLLKLNEINWIAVQSDRWSGNNVLPSIKEGKQAEFLLEHSLRWNLVDRIVVYSQEIYDTVKEKLSIDSHCPLIEIKRNWYY